MIAMRFFGWLALMLGVLPTAAFGIVNQPSGGDWRRANEAIFLPNEMTRVNITIDPADLQHFLDNPGSNDVKRVTMHWQNSVIDEVLEDVGFRIRGNTSRNAARKSWKLEVRAFDAHRFFHELEEINLNGSNNDPSLIRSMVAWEMIRRMGIPGSRTHLVALYFNGEFWSLQTHVEHIDEEFVENYFTDKTGNLYKCLYQGAPADLGFIPGEDYTNHAGGDVYRETNNNNNPARDYSDLADLIRLINFGSQDDIMDRLDREFDVDSFLRYLALNVGMGGWDDYWYGSNNYYLYRNPNHARFHLIPYDYDNSFGIDFFNTDWSVRHFDGWGNGGFGSTPAPLVQRVFGVSEWRRQYRRYLVQVADLLQDGDLRSQVNRWNDLVTPYMDGTIESGGRVGAMRYFAGALTLPANWRGPERMGGHQMGVLPFMDRRATTLRQQVADFFDTPPLPTVRINEAMPSNGSTIADPFGDFDDWVELHNFGTEPVDISGWYLTDALTFPMKYEFPTPTILPAGGFLLVWCDGQPHQGDFHAPFRLGNNGNEYLGLYMDRDNGRILVDHMLLPSTPRDLSYGRFPDAVGEERVFSVPTPGGPNNPADGPVIRTPPRLFINEFLASNQAAERDEFGERDDWIEIYNDEDESVDLSGMFLTDNLTNIRKWQFIDGITIPAKGFLVVWADSQPQQGPLHTNFALSKSGEAIGLFDTDANLNQVIDSFAFGPQDDDVTFGRLPDGAPGIVRLPRRTMGSSNNVILLGTTWWAE